MPEKPSIFSKKALIALVFIALFTLSLAAVFLNPSPASETNVGYVNVSRSESYWENTLGNVTEARYLVNYGIYAVSAAPKVTITDKAEAHLKQIDIAQDTSNVKVSYDEATGTITVVVTDMVAADKVFAQVAFDMDPVDIFAPGERPTTSVTPENIYWGDNTQVDISIAPFRVTRTVNVTEVGVYTWLTNAVAEISNVSTTPTAVCDPPAYQAIWQYKAPTAYNYAAHRANYTVRLPTTTQSGDILLRTWVEVRYSGALRMAKDGTIAGADGYFFRVDYSISYQYEKAISTRSVG
ncbi:MAG: hypothetical protein NTV61_00510 [Candidatus Bathyarchaeota archaeon]|nr:hypothetical protein [Candidatus Bathyarchaeota archaeon]